MRRPTSGELLAGVTAMRRCLATEHGIDLPVLPATEVLAVAVDAMCAAAPESRMTRGRVAELRALSDPGGLGDPAA